jgi:hypothetical protein
MTPRTDRPTINSIRAEMEALYVARDRGEVGFTRAQRTRYDSLLDSERWLMRWDRRGWTAAV